MKNSVVLDQLGVAGVPAQGCTVRPWAAYVGSALALSGVHTPVSAVLKQDSAVMTPAVDAAPKAAPRKDVFARPGIRTEGPPV